MFAISFFNVFLPEGDKLQLSTLRGVRGPGQRAWEIFFFVPGPHFGLGRSVQRQPSPRYYL